MSKTEKKSTEFGKWYDELPKVERKRKDREFEQLGITRGRMNNWRTRRIAPQDIETIEKVALVTGIEATKLFPY